MMTASKSDQEIWHKRFAPEQRKPEDARSPGDIDYARVIHSGSFRRLQGKTQILNLGDSDFYRTRLTHSLEVAQIAGGLAKQIIHDHDGHDAVQYVPERSMMHAIACTHDLGPPPFGHGGEVALNYCVRDHGGFEGNGQTLRILSKLEKFSAAAGSNLTREALLGLLKYPVSYSKALHPTAKEKESKLRPKMRKNTSGTPILERDSAKPPKCYLDTEQDIVDWMLEKLSPSDRDLFQTVDAKDGKHNSARHKSFACSIMDLADDISYGVHDLEDVLALRLVKREQFETWSTKDKAGAMRSMSDECAGLIAYLQEKYPEEYGKNSAFDKFVDMLFGNGDERKHQINRVLNYVIPTVTVREEEGFEQPRLRYRATLPEEVRRFVSAVKNFVYDEVILSPEVQHLEFKGQSMAIAVFEVMRAEPEKFLPRDIFKKCKSEPDHHRSICDYIAGMTDTHLLRTYERLFSPRMGSVFDRL